VLLEAGRAVFAGEGRRALDLLATVDVLPTERLEIWRMGLRATASRSLSVVDQASFIDQLRAWATTPLRRAKRSGWLGNLRYRQGRYLAAARLHGRSAIGREREDERLSARYNMANCLLEAGRIDEALATASAIVGDAAACRLPRYEALASWVVRTASYRRGEGGSAMPELVEAAATVGPKEEALLAASEAAWAWRGRDARMAADLAQRARARFVETRSQDAEILMAALVAATDWAAGAPYVQGILLRVEDAPPGIAAQVYALLQRGAPQPDPEWAARARAAARRGRWPAPALRREVLSITEATGPVQV
jgi:hypothetical protein